MRWPHRIRARPAQYGLWSASWLAFTLTQSGSRFASCRFRPSCARLGPPGAAVPTRPWTGQSPVTTRAVPHERLKRITLLLTSPHRLRSVPDLLKEDHNVIE